MTVIATGMITSDLGLVEIPHLKVPAGAHELTAGMVKKDIPEVFDQAIWFIPGVRNVVENTFPANITNMDIMRGEEVEAIGAIAKLGINGPAVLVLPGSHTKMIKLDRKNRISGSITTMTGEMLEFLTKKSILAAALDEEFSDFLDEEAVKLGAKTSATNGLNRTAFSVRLLKMYTDYSRNQRANYLLGAVFANDIKAIKNNTVFSVHSNELFVILGNSALGKALKVIIENDQDLNGNVMIKETPNLAGLGAVEIAKLKNTEEDKRDET